MKSISFPSFVNWISGDVAIDLGTANTLIWMKGEVLLLMSLQ